MRLSKSQDMGFKFRVAVEDLARAASLLLPISSRNLNRVRRCYTVAVEGMNSTIRVSH